MVPEGERVITRRGPGVRHAHIARPRFAPKSNKLIYWAKDPTADGGDRIFIVTPDGALATDIAEPGPLTFSEDGSRWGTTSPVRAVIPGEFDEEGAPRFRTIATVIIDGVNMGHWARASVPQFSADGKHAAYLYEDADGRGAVLVDGVRRWPIAALEGPCAPSAVTDNGTVFSLLSTRYLTNGKLLALVRHADGFTLYLDDERLASYPTTALEGGAGFVVAPTEECRTSSAIAPRSFRTAEHGPAAAWWERVPGPAAQWHVVRNGVAVDDVVCSRPWADEPPQISSDGRAVAYGCVMEHSDKPDTVDVVTPGGQRHGPYHAIWGVSFSDDATRVAWGASDGSAKRAWSIIVDGEPVVQGFPTVYRPRFTPDGKHVVWQAQRSSNGRSVVGFDTRRLASFDEVYWGPEFPTRDRVSWVVRRGARVVRIVADANPQPTATTTAR